MLPKAMGSNELPTIINTKSGVFIRHKEYLGDIVNTQAFTNTVFPLNPGLVGSFPWLSQVAEAFEEYEWRGLVFQFRTMSSDMILSTATSTALGSVVMATQYDVLDTPFVNKSQMENHCYANSRKPSQSFLHGVECARGNSPVTRLFTRAGAVPPTGDARLYDLGNFQIATQGMQGTGTGTIGELWCSYEIRLFKPQIGGINQIQSSILYDHWILSGNLGKTLSYWGTNAPVLSNGSSNFTQLVNDTGSSNALIQFPAGLTSGRFMIVIGWSVGPSRTLVLTPTIPNLLVPYVIGVQSVTVVDDNHVSGTTNGFMTFDDGQNSSLTAQRNSSTSYFEVDITPDALGDRPTILMGFPPSTVGTYVQNYGATGCGDVRIIEINPAVF